MMPYADIYLKGRMLQRVFSIFIPMLTIVIFACDLPLNQFFKKTPENQFTLLTYNIAGLPLGISQSKPEKNTPLIGEKINDFDIVCVQEDFGYHHLLEKANRHPYRSTPETWVINGLVGDGLNIFSFCKYSHFKRMNYTACYGYLDNGNDCLTHKGCTFAQHEVSPGRVIDIYNTHLDAGEDLETKARQVDQLIGWINSHATGNAVILAGDFNMHDREPFLPILLKLKNNTGLADAREYLGVSYAHERVDKILFKSGNRITLRPVAYVVDDDGPRFFWVGGERLSDHSAVHVLFEWVGR